MTNEVPVGPGRLVVDRVVFEAPKTINASMSMNPWLGLCGSADMLRVCVRLLPMLLR